MPSGKILLEICTDGLEAAMAAQAGGADRIELCGSLELGGVTPSFATLQLTCERLHIPVHVLIRPRAGDFCYSAEEFEVMARDIMICKELGIKGVVFGILLPDGNIDKARCLELASAGRPMSICFHRAFDFCMDPFKGLNDIIECGFDRILSAGQQNNVMEGLDLLKTLVTAADKRIIIMPGSGIRAYNITTIIKETGASEVHTTAGIQCDSMMSYRKTHLDLGEGGRSYHRYTTDADKVRELVDILKEYSNIP